MAYESYNPDNPMQLGSVDASKTGIYPSQKVFNTYLTTMYGWANNAYFYNIIPPQWRQYYWHNIRAWIEWSNGYSRVIHGTAGVIPTRFGYQMISTLKDAILTGGHHFDGAENSEDDSTALDFISNDWALERFDFNDFLNRLFVNTLSGGTSLVVANDDTKDIWFESLRIDRYLVNIDARGRILESKIFTDVLEQQVNGVNSASQNVKNWYLIEQRFYKNNKPYVQYCLMPQEGLVNSKFFGSPQEMRGHDWRYIPKEVQDAFKAAYGNQKINKPIELKKFDGELGCWLIKNTSSSQMIPDLRFGESQLVSAIPFLMTFDKAYTDMINDAYIGKGKVILPKSSNPNDVMADGLDHSIVTRVPFSGVDVKPEVIQFDLRVDEHIANQEHLIKRIADSIGLSISTVSSSLTSQASHTSKTAKEVSSELTRTANTVESKRALALPVLNKMLSFVLKYYSKAGKVFLRFSQAGLTNVDNLTIQTIRKWRDNLISLEQAIKDLHPDWNQNEIDSEIELIRENMKEQMLQEQGIMPDGESIIGGLADGKTLEEIAIKHNVDLVQLQREFEIGKQVEMEHTDTEEEAVEITLDHLFERPHYYSKLDTMEKQPVKTKKKENPNKKKDNMFEQTSDEELGRETSAKQDGENVQLK